jgi:hypothetical protein
MPSNDQIIEAALRKFKPLNVTHEMEFGGYSVRFYYPTPDQEIKFAIKVSEEEAADVSFPDEAGSEILDFGVEQDHEHVVEECADCASLYRLGVAKGHERATAQQRPEREPEPALVSDEVLTVSSE